MFGARTGAALPKYLPVDERGGICRRPAGRLEEGAWNGVQSVQAAERIASGVMAAYCSGVSVAARMLTLRAMTVRL